MSAAGGQPAVDVLLVEDEADLRETVAEILELSGYTVVEARDGREALQSLESVLPRLVLLDIMMPVVSGPEVLWEMRKLATPPPVVVVTALSRIEDEGGLRPELVLQKPVDMDLLLELVRQYCRPPGK